MILIGVVLFTLTTPTQALPRESIVTMKYWNDYASSLCCECYKFQHKFSDQEGYRVMNITDVVDSTDNDDNDRNENTEDTEAE